MRPQGSPGAHDGEPPEGVVEPAAPTTDGPADAVPDATAEPASEPAAGLVPLSPPAETGAAPNGRRRAGARASRRRPPQPSTRRMQPALAASDGLRTAPSAVSGPAARTESDADSDGDRASAPGHRPSRPAPPRPLHLH